MWIPAWLGEIYAYLSQRFGTEVFTFREAQDVLGMGEGKINVAFSKLHSVRVLTLFERSRPRAYRLISPADFVLLASERVQGIEGVRQERYVPIVLGQRPQLFNARRLQLAARQIFAEQVINHFGIAPGPAL